MIKLNEIRYIYDSNCERVISYRKMSKQEIEFYEDMLNSSIRQTKLADFGIGE